MAALNFLKRQFRLDLERNWTLPGWYSLFYVKRPNLKRVSKRIKRIRKLTRKRKLVNERPNVKYAFQHAAYVKRKFQFALLKKGLFKPNYFFRPPYPPILVVYKMRRRIRVKPLILRGAVRPVTFKFFRRPSRFFRRRIRLPTDWRRALSFKNAKGKKKRKKLSFLKRSKKSRYRRLPLSRYLVKIRPAENNIFLTASYQDRSVLHRIRSFKSTILRLHRKLRWATGIRSPYPKFPFKVPKVGRSITLVCTGTVGYSGPRRGSPSACEEAGRELARRLRRKKPQRPWIVFHSGKNRISRAAARGLLDKRFKLRPRYASVDPKVPHSLGLRKPKPRRV